MCLELLYENSPNRGIVEFSYLAINDKMIINKSYESPNEDDPEYVETHGGNFNSHILVKFNAKDDTIMTALLNFEDIDLDDFEKNWDSSLTKALTDLSNNGFDEELVDNITTMFCDAIQNAGFGGTYIGELIESANQITDNIYIRTVDFQMHVPSNDDLHPGFDT